MRKIAVFMIAGLLCPLMFAASTTTQDLESRRKALNDLLADQWEYTLRTNPVFASIIGDKRYNDKLDDGSEAAVLKDLEETRKYVARFQAIDTTGFPEQEALNKTLMVRGLQEQLDTAKFKEWEMPVNQFNGLHIQAPQIVTLLSFETVKDYDDYIARLNQFPKAFGDVMDNMRKGMAENRMPPRILLEQVVKQADNLAQQKPEESPFARPFAKFPANFSEADKARLKEQGIAAVRQSVLPTYVKFTAFVRDDYAPKGRTEPGAWALPDGQAYYAALVKRSTTTELTPEQIHQLGLAQVKEIEGRMLQVANQLGYKDLKSFNAFLKTDPKLHPKSRQEILDLYQKYTDQMYTKLPQLFTRMPKAKMQIRPTEEFREKEASGAEYKQGTPDGSRPGAVEVNTGDFANRSTLDIETTAYHEGVPGHHMQISIQQELPTLPPFRQQSYYTAYTEGWALYSEELGKEVGFFQDPYSYYGHLQDDMLRAIRLVVDTGFHYKHWSRQQVVDFFHDHSAIDEPSVQSETDRYMAWPAQALGYKIGQLEIRKLREEAKQQLGGKFDIRGFHDEVLGAGALPMDVLDARIHSWVAAQQGSVAGGSGGTDANPKTSR